MAYIGQGIDRFSNVEKLDAITPATATGAGPYNLTKRWCSIYTIVSRYNGSIY